MEKEIIIEYKPNIDTLVKVSKYLLLRIPYLKFIPIILLFVLLQNNLSQFLGSNNNINPTKWDFFDYLPIVIILFVWGFIYFRSISSMKKDILKNKKSLETQKIIFKKDSYIQEGETFKVENFWKELYQIKETNDWFLIYPKKNSALPIVKADLKDNQYKELKELFSSIDIKKSLKS
jgi:hypothetical protein